MKNYGKPIDCGKTTASNSLWQSQNYLHNKSLVMNLLKKTSICKDDTVIEIGPGKGIITWQLYRKCRKVYGIEYDFYLCRLLKQKFTGAENVKIIHGDFLKYELPKEMPYKVFSNIPFNITAEIINKLVFNPNPPEDLYLIMQREAAGKYAGNPYSCECMRSLLLKPFFEAEIVHCFRNTDFYPVPGVNAVLLNIRKRQSPLIDGGQAHDYNDFITYAFSMHGKSLKERLARVFTGEQFKRLACEAKADISCGPLDLNYRQWLILFEYYIRHVSPEKRKDVRGAYARLMKRQSKLSKVHRNSRSSTGK